MALNRPLDVLLVHADSSQAAYQALSETYSAIEPPTWCLLLAQSCRAKGYGAAILDCAAEQLTIEQASKRVLESKPRLVCFVVYGQNPNSGTTNMIGATALCAHIKLSNPQLRTCFVGSHTSALPLEVLALPYVDFVLLNEGVYALHNLLASDLNNCLDQVRGLGWKNGQIHLNPPERVVPQERMDIDLPGYAWDLLPYRTRPLDLYRAHFWHAGFNHDLRTPFAAIYTSLGCRFRCDFCMINILNRTDNSPETTAAHSPNMRFWTPQLILREFDRLAEMGAHTVRISDEMFFLDRKYYEPLLTGLVERNHAFRLWSYARVDTVRPQALELFRRSGMAWLALGIEAANQTVRREVSKGSFQEINIRKIVSQIRDRGIHVIANYIFGFPEDTLDTMRETLDLALELNTEMANFYPCMALPGSPLHLTARKQGWALPESYAGYAFLSYEAQPLPTRHLSAAQVLQFRDHAWQTYFHHPPYLDLVERSFGIEQRRNVEAMAQISLRRRLLEHQ